jgi:hypothetical protein
LGYAKKLRTREEVASHIARFEAIQNQDRLSQRDTVEQLGIPRSTLQEWLKRRDRIDSDPQLISFFESPVGVAFLHRLIIAAHFVLTFLSPSGIRLVSIFIELTGLDHFVAVSYGAQQKVSVQIEETVTSFNSEEIRRLSENMHPRKITVVEDETFHPENCLVGIDAVSNFIVLEKYASGRKAKDWTSALNEALAGMPVEVIQSTSDEAKGILHHVQKDMGAHHSPDLFHVRHELAKATSIALYGKTKQAEKAVEKANCALEKKLEQKNAWFAKEHGPGRPPCFDKQIAESQTSLAEAEIQMETACELQSKAREVIRGIGNDYHPYDLETGKPRDARIISSALESHFTEIEMVAAQAGLADRCIQKIEKAKRVTVHMIATIAFFFLTIKAKVEALSLPSDVEQIVYNVLIPGIYLELAASKASRAAERRKLKRTSEVILEQALTPESVFQRLEREDRLVVMKVAKECAEVFQRSSSAVEGRNGQLSLHHHGIHRIRDRKLSALTTVHNFFIERQDNTTAAERFFNQKPRDLFQYVLDRVDIPGRPAQKRPQKNNGITSIIKEMM